MNMWYRLILVSDIFLLCYANSNDSKADDIEKQQCPQKDVCSHLTPDLSPSTQHHQKSYKKVCCKGCSCDHECTTSKDCCFRGLTHDNELQQTTECIPPNLGVEKHIQNHYQSYKMVVRVPRFDSPEKSPIRTGIEHNDITNMTICGDSKIAWWGSLRPVYSPSTKLIYKNPTCADESNVTDGKVWDAFLLCPFFSNIPFRSFPAVDNFYSLPFDCQIHFEPPTGIGENVLCADHTVRTCKENITIPEELDMTVEEALVACKADLGYPVRRHGDVYANIFCYVCNFGTMPDSYICGLEFYDARSAGLMSLLLSPEPSMARRKESHVNNMRYPLACNCSHNENPVKCCREVLCPCGQTRDESGKCQINLEAIFGATLEIALKLIPESPFDREKLLRSNITRRPISWLKSPWDSQRWRIMRVLVADPECIVEANTPCEVITVVIRHKQQTFGTKRVFAEIASTLSNTWTICTDGQCQHAEQAFAQIAAFYDVNETIAIPGWISLKYNSWSQLQNRSHAYHKVYDKLFMYFASNIIRIRKTFFCRQINLRRSEYRRGALRLYLYNGNRQLYDNEYDEVVNPNQPNEYTISRICLEDSSLIVINAASRVSSNIKYDGSKLVSMFKLATQTFTFTLAILIQAAILYCLWA